MAFKSDLFVVAANWFVRNLPKKMNVFEQIHCVFYIKYQ